MNTDHDMPQRWREAGESCDTLAEDAQRERSRRHWARADLALYVMSIVATFVIVWQGAQQ